MSRFDAGVQLVGGWKRFLASGRALINSHRVTKASCVHSVASTKHQETSMDDESIDAQNRADEDPLNAYAKHM